MTNPYNFIDSFLVVKASGTDVSNDLTLPEGKSIAQLIYDQENSENKINQEKNQEE